MNTQITGTYNLQKIIELYKKIIQHIDDDKDELTVLV